MEFFYFLAGGLFVLFLVWLKGRIDFWIRWRDVRLAARVKGFKLVLVSDKRYHRRRRPLPRGGTLYQSGDYVKVRHEHVPPNRVMSFLREL